MVKVLLCDMPVSSDSKFGKMKRFGSSYPPINIMLLGTLARQAGHDVRLLTDDTALVDIADTIRDFSPDVVGLTFMTLGAGGLSGFCEMMTLNAKGTPLIVGGYHASLFPEQILRENPRIDLLFKGEAEKSFLQYLDAFNSGKVDRSGYKDLFGVCYIDNGEEFVQTQPAGRIEDLDDLPFPDYSLIDKYSKRFYPSAKHHFLRAPQAMLLTGRGCPFDCYFCGRMLLGRTVRQNTPEYMLELLKWNVDHFGFQSAVYADEFLTQNKRTMFGFAELLHKHNLTRIHWAGGGRVNNMTSEYAGILSNAGCKMLTFGLESGSQKILDLLNKKSKIDQMSHAIQEAYKGGLNIQGNFMLGNPGETCETIEETRRFVLENPLDFVAICFFTPMPGSHYWENERYAAFGTMHSMDYSKFNTFDGIVFTPTGLTSTDLIKARSRIYRDFYLRPKRVAREFRHITNPASWRSALRCLAGI